MDQLRPIEGFEGLYSIHADGRIQSHLQTHRILKGRPVGHGYLAVELRRHDRAYPRYIHDLVCKAFIGDKPSGMTVNHKDGNKTNNHVSNLEYATPKEQSNHAKALGLLFVGERHPMAKLTAIDVQEIRISPLTARELSVKYSISYPTIRRILRGDLWKDVK